MVSSQSRDSKNLPYLQNHPLGHAEEGKNKFMRTFRTSTTIAILTALVALAAPAMAEQKSTDGKIRIFVTDRPITEVISMIRSASAYNASASGNAYGFSANATAASATGGITTDKRGGADPRTLEVSEIIANECHKPNVIVTSDPNAADYVLDFRRERGKRSTFFAMGGLTGLAISAASKIDHAALYASNGDMIYAAKARTVSGAVKEVCSNF